jgi:hypothetical protein
MKVKTTYLEKPHQRGNPLAQRQDILPRLWREGR